MLTKESIIEGTSLTETVSVMIEHYLESLEGDRIQFQNLVFTNIYEIEAT